MLLHQRCLISHQLLVTKKIFIMNTHKKFKQTFLLRQNEYTHPGHQHMEQKIDLNYLQALLFMQHVKNLTHKNY